MREDGAPATLDEIVAAALRSRGLNPAVGRWDAWKGDDGNWVGQLTWTAGHTRTTPTGATRPLAGGTTDALDNTTADELLHPGSAGRHQLQPVADPAESVTVDAQSVVAPPPRPPNASRSRITNRLNARRKGRPRFRAGRTSARRPRQQPTTGAARTTCRSQTMQGRSMDPSRGGTPACPPGSATDRRRRRAEAEGEQSDGRNGGDDGGQTVFFSHCDQWPHQ